MLLFYRWKCHNWLVESFVNAKMSNIHWIRVLKYKDLHLSLSYIILNGFLEGGEGYCWMDKTSNLMMGMNRLINCLWKKNVASSPNIFFGGSFVLRGFFLGCTMINLCRQTAGSTSVMSSSWWERWPLLVRNGTSPALVDESSCFNTTQSTVLKGVKFGGVPIVLLLNFSAFLVCVCQSACDEIWKCDPCYPCFFLCCPYRQDAVPTKMIYIFFVSL